LGIERTPTAAPLVAQTAGQQLSALTVKALDLAGNIGVGAMAMVGSVVTLGALCVASGSIKLQTRVPPLSEAEQFARSAAEIARYQTSGKDFPACLPASITFDTIAANTRSGKSGSVPKTVIDAADRTLRPDSPTQPLCRVDGRNIPPAP
jgi:hypothetical protein